jgi:arylsulfatase A-like enzyme
MNASSLTSRAAAGAIAGLTVWLAYYSVELLVIRFSPLLHGASPVNRFPREAALAFPLIYGLIGALLGPLAAVVARTREAGGDGGARYRLAALGLLQLAVIAAHLGVERPSGAVLAPLGLIAAASAIALVWLRPLAGILGYWTVCVALCGTVWLVKIHLGSWDPRDKLLPLIAGLAAVFAAGALARFLWRRVARGGALSSAAHLKAAASAAALVSLAAILWQPRPLRQAGAPVPAGAVPRPSVILVVLDTVRAENLSIYGHHRETTPKLREFLRGATLFRHATATSDMTLPTHASIFTGVFASSHGAHYTSASPFGAPLDRRWLTLPKFLHAAGYRTVAVAANHAYLAPKFGFAAGFDYYDARAGSRFLYAADNFEFRERLRETLARAAGVDPGARRYRPAAEITREAIAALPADVRPERPVFLFLNYMDAHHPYAPPPPFDRRFPGWESPVLADDWRTLIEDVNERKRRITDSQRAYGLSQYDGALAYLDSQIALLFEHLRRAGIYDDALVVVTSDHGEAFGEKDLMEHGVSVYQNQVHVPLIVKWPGQKHADVVDERVSQVDILPTVLAAAGLGAPEGIHGIDLRRAREAGPRWIYSESFRRAEGARFRRVERAVFRDASKLITSDKGMREMYDVVRDPLEQHNLYRPADGIAIAMLEHLEGWIRTIPKEPTSAAPMDAETRERLRSLGYIQ